MLLHVQTSSREMHKKLVASGIFGQENYVVRYRWMGGLLITISPLVLLEFFINPGLISFPSKMHYMTDNLSIPQVSLFLTHYPPNF